MHVGHLRSAVIGDSVVKLLEFTGETVVRRHHIGDWGTQFGMLIQYLDEHPHELDHKAAEVTGEEAMSNLDRLYKAARRLFDSDEEFKTRARRRVVDLQAGDARTLAMWQKFVDESKIYFFSVFDKLDMDIRDPDIVGESGYNDMLEETCRLLEESGVAVRSEGALCVFFDDVKGPDGKPVPLIVRKSDGGYGYAATDLSAIRDRVFNLKANSIIYVVDARQSLHFKMVFETARRAGWLNDDVKAYQLAFGTVLGKDGKPFKTREGETVRLVDLLDEAIERASAVVREKAQDLSEEEITERGSQVGIGAVKYADLSTSASRDYKFDLDQMVSLNGDTSVYLQYAYARIQSILRKAGEVRPAAHPDWNWPTPSANSACTWTSSRRRWRRPPGSTHRTSWPGICTSWLLFTRPSTTSARSSRPRRPIRSRTACSCATSRPALCTRAWRCSASGRPSGSDSAPPRQAPRIPGRFPGCGALVRQPPCRVIHSAPPSGKS